jgi:hypothetical protein
MTGIMIGCGGGGGSMGTGTSTSSTSSTSSDSTTSGDTSSTSVSAIEALNSSSISWTAPTTYEDGSVLSPSDLGGYKVYVGNSADTMTLHTTITDISTTEFVFTDLGKGTRYISVSSYDINGNESQLSDTTIVNIS